MSTPATQPAPAYAVIFTSHRAEGDKGYAEAAAEILALAQAQPGFLGAESVRDAHGFGITVSYWASLEAVEAFKRQPRHAEVRTRMADWYEGWSLQVCRVERRASWPPAAAG